MKQCLIIGNMNAITYKECFSLIKRNKLWLGNNWVKTFSQPNNSTKNFGNICWFSTLNNAKNKPLELTKTYNPIDYPKYDNYDAIEVSKTKNIPKDYEGVMGVPISFLTKYCPEQFEIVGCFNDYKESDMNSGLMCGTKTEYIDKNGNTKIWNGPTINKKAVYFRILIRNKHPILSS